MKKTLTEIEEEERKWQVQHLAQVSQEPPFFYTERLKKNKNFPGDGFGWALSKLLKVVNQDSIILDFCCGDGDRTCLLSQCLTPRKIFAFDLCEELIEIARTKIAIAGVKNVEFTCSSFTNLRYPEKYFDIVFVWSVLHHFPEYILDALKVIFYLLKDEGYLVLREPICDSKAFNLARNLIPISKIATPNEAQLGTKELIRCVSQDFKILDSKHFSLLTRLQRVVNNSRLIDLFSMADEFLLKLKFINYFAGSLVIFARKNNEK
ncbi:MAG: class I SAM-dependent methyltransferase [Candidatus Omnitrophota bacterium]|nr:class I SAM-dependent methyltransferase [Candidatus Omnitrophota bacterium]